MRIRSVVYFETGIVCASVAYVGRDGASAFLVHTNQRNYHSIFMSRGANLGFDSVYIPKTVAWTT